MISGSEPYVMVWVKLLPQSWLQFAREAVQEFYQHAQLFHRLSTARDELRSLLQLFKQCLHTVEHVGDEANLTKGMQANPIQLGQHINGHSICFHSTLRSIYACYNI